MKTLFKFIFFGGLWLMSDCGMAQTIKFSMEPFKAVTKEWKQPKDGVLWSIIDATDSTVTAYKIEKYIRKIRRFDFNFNIIAEFEYKDFDYGIHAQKNGIDIFYNKNKNSLAYWLLDAQTLLPVKNQVIDTSDDYYIKKVETEWSSDDKYIRVRIGALGSKDTFYDSELSKITEKAEIERIRNLFVSPLIVYKDDKSEVSFYKKIAPSEEYVFGWREKTEENDWKNVQECNFGKKEEDYAGGKILKIDCKKREWLTVFVYKDRCYWIEFDTLWKGWTSKNDIYRLMLKSYGRNGDYQEKELSTEFNGIPPSVCYLSDGRCLIWQQNVKVSKEYAQRIGMLTIK